MTETSAVTVSNFVSAVLVAGVSIVVITQIVSNMVSETNSGMDRSAIQELESKINRVCEEDQDSARGEISTSSGTSIVLEGDNMKLEGIDPDNYEEGQAERDLSCPIESRRVLEGTELYTVTKSEGYYVMR